MINEQIRDREVRLIGPDGEQIGVVSSREAQKIADEAGLDLVKIAPNAKPPVCKVIDYGKYRYDLARKEKDAKKKQKTVELKTNGYQLYYWESDNTAEVDFLIQKENHVIPVECKAGNHVKAKSMMVYMEKYAPAYAIRISARNFGMVQGIKSVPLYSVFCI